MIDYLIQISEKSYSLIHEQFTPVFQAIDVKPPDDQHDEQLDDDEIENEIDCMNSDDEDEEEIEEENEEDRAFLDDDSLDEEP